MMRGNPVAFWRKQYELGGKSITKWVDTAYGLVSAADALQTFNGNVVEEFTRGTEQRTMTEAEYKRMSVGPPARMLRVMAAECYLKALWLKAENELVNRDGRYQPILNGSEHELDELASAVALTQVITFNADELKLLRFVSKWIAGGRYPIPRHYTDVSMLEQEPSGNVVQRDAWQGDPECQLTALITRLHLAVGMTYDFERQDARASD